MTYFKKNLLRVVIVVIAAFANLHTSFAQESPKNIIKTNLLSPIVSTVSLSYERVVSASGSVQIGANYTFVTIGSGDTKTKLRGFSITPEYRFYLSDKNEAPRGFFIAPFLRYQNYELKNTFDNEKAKYSSAGGGLILGGQWIFKNRISLDVWGGPQYNAGTFNYEGNASEDDFTLTGFNGFNIRAGLTLGIAF